MNSRELEHGRCKATLASVIKGIWKEVAVVAVKSPRFDPREIFAKVTSSKLASKPQESLRL